MKKHSLKATSRTVVGRKVKNIRSKGMTPATVYGKKVKSMNVQVSTDELNRVYAQVRNTGLVELVMDKDTKPVLIHTLQVHPVTDLPLHVEFYQVDLKEKVKAKVPIELTGVAPAVLQKIGVLLTVLNEIEVEALPSDLPEMIAVDVSNLSTVDQELKVSDLTPPTGVTLLTETTVGVVKVGALVSKEAEAEAKAAQEAEAKAAQETAAPATEESAPAEAPPNGETKTEPPKEEKK